MKQIFKKTGYLAVLLLIANTAFADMREKMHGGMMEEKEIGGDYSEGVYKCSAGHEGMMEMGHKKHGDENECMSCMKIKMILKNSKSLELTEDQTDKMRALNIECSKNNIKKQSEIDLLKIDKKEQLMKDEADLNEVKKIINKIHELESEVDLGCIETGIKIRKLLNDKQKEKLKEMKRRMM